ncbi:DoxX family protein [Formosa haliotis]|uniref:DoxX family protein n=1 Tax=Formosa haliotis TaxID=1555194 RepID=UPI00082516C2|nr:DoxX family protein [Formosa haliotis]
MKNIINQILNVIAMVAMVFFATPKLLGKPQSVAGFKQFESALGIDADFFMLFTGISELVLAVLLLLFTVTHKKVLGKIAFGFLLITMITALGLEFFARPEPKMLLVVIAIGLASISIYKLKTIR